VAVGSVAVGTGPPSVYVAGRYAYTANHSASTISVVDLNRGLLYASNAEIGNLSAGDAHVSQSLNVANDVLVGGSEHIGGSLAVDQSVAAAGTVSGSNLTSAGHASGDMPSPMPVVCPVGSACAGKTDSTTSTTTATGTGTFYATSAQPVSSTVTATNTSTVTATNYSLVQVLNGGVTAARTLSSADVTGALTYTPMNNSVTHLSGDVPTSQVINGATLTATNVTITAAPTGSMNATAPMQLTTGTSTTTAASAALSATPTVAINTGTATNQVIMGNDARLSDARTPTGSAYAGAGIGILSGTATTTVTAGALSASLTFVNTSTNTGTGNLVGTLTASYLPNASGPQALGNSSVSDNGTVVATTEGLNLQSTSASPAPTVVGSVAVGTNPSSVYVAGRYAYTANHSASTISVIDVSNPASPVVVGSVAVGNSPYSVYVAGRYAYTANYGASTISVVDVSNPASSRGSR
jgi:hypothetical protein